jgi:hypothetical protein
MFKGSILRNSQDKIMHWKVKTKLNFKKNSKKLITDLNVNYSFEICPELLLGEENLVRHRLLKYYIIYFFTAKCYPKKIHI